jgi:sugar/nucleoside kinase (ribokinase family)
VSWASDFKLRPSNSAGFDVVGYGENSIDFLGVTRTWPEADTKAPLAAFEIQPGGQMATAVLAAARLGCRARYIGAFGDDRWAAEVRAALTNGGVDVIALDRAGVQTRAALVIVDGDGRRTIFERRDSRLAAAPEELDARVIQSGRILLLDATDVPGALRAALEARRAGVRVMLDVDHAADGIERLLAAADVVIAPSGFVSSFTGEPDAANATARLGETLAPRLVVSTLGADGSVARYQGREIRTAGQPVDVRDTTGAGDVFRGAFAARWASGEETELSGLLRYANAAAALASRSLGAQGSLPTPAEVEGAVSKYQ